MTAETPGAGLAEKVLAGGRLSRQDAVRLYTSASTAQLGRLADEIRRRKHPEGIVTYIIDRNVNYTNVCVARCNFCAFYRPVGSSEGYVLGTDEIFKKIDETIEVGGVQLLLQGDTTRTFRSSGIWTCFARSRSATRPSSCTPSHRPRSFTCPGCLSARSKPSWPVWSRRGSTACPGAAPRSWSTGSGAR